MKQEVPLQPTKNQEVAFILNSHLLRAKRDKQAIKIFLPTLPEEISSHKMKKEARLYLKEQHKPVSLYKTSLSKDEQTSLQQIRNELSEHDQTYLETKKGNFSIAERSKLLFQAKSKHLSGLTTEERIKMYQDAGYTDTEISNITGKKLLLSATIGTASSVLSESLRLGSAVYDKAVPFIAHIPASDLKGVAIASVLTYFTSVVACVEIDFKLTKKIGTSTNTMLTAFYASANRLLPNKTRDLLSRGLPVGSELLLQSSIIGAAITTTGDLHKVAAISFISAAYNGLWAAGSLTWLHIAKRRSKNKEKATTPVLPS